MSQHPRGFASGGSQGSSRSCSCSEVFDERDTAYSSCRSNAPTLGLPIINDLCIQLHHSVAQEIETLGLTEVLLSYDHRCSVEVCCVWMEVVKKVVLVCSDVHESR